MLMLSSMSRLLGGHLLTDGSSNRDAISFNFLPSVGFGWVLFRSRFYFVQDLAPEIVITLFN